MGPSQSIQQNSCTYSNYYIPMYLPYLLPHQGNEMWQILRHHLGVLAIIRNIESNIFEQFKCQQEQKIGMQKFTGTKQIQKGFYFFFCKRPKYYQMLEKHMLKHPCQIHIMYSKLNKFKLVIQLRPIKNESNLVHVFSTLLLFFANLPHCYFTRLNPKRKGPFYFCLPALLGIHRNLNPKRIFQIQRGIFEGCTNRARPSRPSLKNCQNCTI